MDSATIISGIIQLAFIVLGVWLTLKPINKKWHKPLIGGIIVIGSVGIFLSAYESETLRNQINTIINANKIAATVDDINKLDSHIQQGFDKVVSAIKRKPISQQSQQVTPTIPIVENTRLIQKPTISDNPKFPYGLQVIIQSNVVIQPVGFGLQCDGEIGSIDFFIAGQSVYMYKWSRSKGNTLEFGFDYPQLSPENSLVVTILSKTQMKAIKLYKTRK
jgi:hypothetical protein